MIDADYREDRMEEIDNGGRDGIEKVTRALAERDLKYLLEALKDSNSLVRIAAVLALGEIGGEKASLALLTISRDRFGERPEVRIAALEALGTVYEASRYSSFLEGFIAGDSRKVMIASRKMLRALDPGGYPARLAGAGALDHSAIGVYGAAREGAAVPLLAGFIEERKVKADMTSPTFWGKVYAAAKALKRIGGEGASEALDSLVTWIESAKGSVGAPIKLARLEKIEAVARGGTRI